MGPRFVRITDIDNAGVIQWPSVPGCVINANDHEKYRLAEGDVLFARTGSIEKACIVRDGPDAVFASYLIRGRPRHRMLAEWLRIFVRSSGYVSQAKAASAGVGRANINARTLTRLHLVVPPLTEQRRIAEAVDSYLSRLDEAEAALVRVRHNLKRYRAAVLQAAVEGRLVPTEAELARAEGRDFEPASELLKRILAERRRRWEEAELSRLKASGKAPKDDKVRAKYRAPSSPDLAGLPRLPEGWCWTVLEQLVWQVRDGPHYSPKYADAGVPFVTGGQVRPNGVDFDGAKRITSELHAELCKRVRPANGDVLYTKGGTTGIARVNTYHHEFSVWVHVAVLKLAGLVAPFYLQHALNSPWCYAQAQKYTHGVGNQDLGLTRMIKITIPLPPLAEQHRIVSEVDAQDSFTCTAALSVDRAVASSGRLRQAILKWAFEGKLVDQDPNDEPAAALLERIRATHAEVADAGLRKRQPRARKRR